jgi:hypothetical protein
MLLLIISFVCIVLFLCGNLVLSFIILSVSSNFGVVVLGLDIWSRFFGFFLSYGLVVRWWLFL